MAPHCTAFPSLQSCLLPGPIVVAAPLRRDQLQAHASAGSSPLATASPAHQRGCRGCGSCQLLVKQVQALLLLHLLRCSVALLLLQCCLQMVQGLLVGEQGLRGQVDEPWLQ